MKPVASAVKWCVYTHLWLIVLVLIINIQRHTALLAAGNGIPFPWVFKYYAGDSAL